MSSGKIHVKYPIQVLDDSPNINNPNFPVFEKKYNVNLYNSCLDRKLTKFYGRIINIHFFLSNNKELTNNQKLDYCTIERYFMKLYLREMMKKV